MSNIKITDKTKPKPAVNLKVGQYYRDRTTGDVFIIAKHGNAGNHSLICLKDGGPYTLNATQNIIEAFGNDQADFDLIDNVEIVLF